MRKGKKEKDEREQKDTKDDKRKTYVYQKKKRNIQQLLSSGDKCKINKQDGLNMLMWDVVVVKIFLQKSWVGVNAPP